MDFDFIVNKQVQDEKKGNSISPENLYLVKMLKQRNTEAFHTIYNIYFTRIQVYCAGYVTENYIAQEMTQDTFVKLWEKCELLLDDTLLQPLLYRIARNNCLNYLKHLKVTEKFQKMQLHRQSEIELNIYALADESAQMIISEELEAKILKSINLLSPACKKVFELSRMEEKTYSEIAKELDIAVKTVENQIQKALKILRKELKEYLPFLIFIHFF
jgi:RNA polymerase sigma-70 factor (ECF subfamily)